MHDMERAVDLDAVPDRRTVLALTFRDTTPPLRHWWLIFAPGEVELCDEDPGGDADVHLMTTLRAFVPVWRGDVRWIDAVAAGDIELHGRRPVVRQVPNWFHLSHFSAVPRPTAP